MANPDHPTPNGSRLEQLLTKSPNWKKRALRNIEVDATPLKSDVEDRDSKTARLALRLSAQLDERNEEIQRLRRAVSRLEVEMSQLDLAHRREVELHRAELESLQDAYNQFEKESDRLLSKLDQQNERLLSECRNRNVRSLLEN